MMYASNPSFNAVDTIESLDSMDGLDIDTRETLDTRGTGDTGESSQNSGSYEDTASFPEGSLKPSEKAHGVEAESRDASSCSDAGALESESAPGNLSETLSENLEKEIAHMKDQLLRALAETENVRRRASQEKEDALKYGITNFARDVLSIADTLSLALEHLAAQTVSDVAKPFVDGIKMTEKELSRVLAKHHIKKIGAPGEKFDSHLHQAMFEEEKEDQEPGTIAQVMQAGYVLHERLLRPALVGVVKKKSSS